MVFRHKLFYRYFSIGPVLLFYDNISVCPCHAIVRAQSNVQSSFFCMLRLAGQSMAQCDVRCVVMDGSHHL